MEVPLVLQFIDFSVTSTTLYTPCIRSDLPEDIRVSPLSVVLKPTGRARIINDLSWPRVANPKTCSPTPISINASINMDNYRVKMANLNDLLMMIDNTDGECWASKIDWADAFKHIAIHPDDIKLQVFSFGGKYFADLTAIFGCSSSPAIFDSAAELILQLSCWMASLHRNTIAKVLDDCICINKKDLVDKWSRSYLSVCSRVGVKLAPLDNIKAFLSSQSGTLLGVDFNFVEKTWTMDVLKINKILYILFDILENQFISESKLETLCGKLTHYMVILGGQYER